MRLTCDQLSAKQTRRMRNDPRQLPSIAHLPNIEQMDTNSKRTRVEPFFGWLREHGEVDWPARLLHIAHGIDVNDPGSLVALHFETEVQVVPSASRLAWLIRNAERLAPADGRRWDEYRRRVVENPDRLAALALLDEGGYRGVDPQLVLEGPSHADCLIECENAIIWIEGKRNDWIATGTTWDVTRDQLARNLEAAWLLAQKKDPNTDYGVIICHEGTLKYHEELLVKGYRDGTWSAGWPHIERNIREDFRHRIGTITWNEMALEWPELRTALTATT